MQSGEYHVLAVRTILLREGGFRVGNPQAGSALTVTVNSMQGRPAQAALTAQHLQLCCENLLLEISFFRTCQMMAGEALTVARMVKVARAASTEREQQNSGS